MRVDTYAVDKVLENLAVREEKRFNAYQIARLSKQEDVEQVNDYLLYKAQGPYAILSAKIETLCPENHPDAQFEFGESLPDYEIECYVCGEEYIPDINFSHLVFYFTKDYLENVKKKKSVDDGSNLATDQIPEMNQLMWIPDLIKSGKFIIINNGGIDMSKNDFSGWDVDAKNSPFAVGPKAKVKADYKILEQNTNVSEELLKLLEVSELDAQQKQEMKEIIEVAAEEVGNDKPKKPIVRGLLNSATAIMDTVAKSPQLITAFEKWSTYIGGFLG